MTLDKSRVMLAACDNGMGMPSELVRRVFDLFTKGKEPPTVRKVGWALVWHWSKGWYHFTAARSPRAAKDSGGAASSR